MLTWFGFCVAIITAIVIGLGNVIAGGILVLVSGYFDILDGALARRTNQATRFGAVLDSTLDRFSEAVVLLGITALFLTGRPQWISNEWAVLLVSTTLIGSLLVSYIRARAETQGINCEVGIFTRAERVIVLTLGLLVNQIVIALGIIAILSFVTVGQRLFHVYRKTKASKN
jgi:CDP-diacylglycerol--glycerol-3-phosphate 3-phosphatidyltransferase